MECIVRVCPVRHGIRKRFDHLVELDHGARPAMGDDKRYGFGVRTRPVDEVNAEPIDLGDVLRKTVEVRLARPPVVPALPVVGEFAGIGQGYALVPVELFAWRSGFGIRPTGAGETFRQIV